jgi:hypothetical protein
MDLDPIFFIPVFIIQAVDIHRHEFADFEAILGAKRRKQVEGEKHDEDG